MPKPNESEEGRNAFTRLSTLNSQPSTSRRLFPPHRDEQTVESRLDLAKTGALQIFLQLLGRRAFRHVRWTIVRRIMLVVLENAPAFVRAKIGVIDVNPAARSQNTKGFLHQTEAVPHIEVHETHRSLGESERE